LFNVNPYPPMRSTPRPSITEIAAVAGVSAMSVSNALRGNNHVSAATRAKILRVAKRLGYQPDPLLTHLMHHVRSRRVRQTQANLGVLMLSDDAYSQRLIAGVEARADRLGFTVDKIATEPYAGNSGGLTRMLQARGIEGLLLPPARVPMSLASLLDWSQFSTVAMTYSVTEPRFHRVVPHGFHNAMLLLQMLRQLGYRRPSVATNKSVSLRANYAYASALASDALRSGKAAVPPFVSDAPTPDGLAGVGDWFRRHKPDAIILIGARHVRKELLPELGAKMIAGIGIAVADYDPEYPIPGIDQKTDLLGATAVDMLVAQLHRQEKGIPVDPVVSMVEGKWVEAPK
jgi:DNA-binding LacI/PurR family transcriptional regulator